MSDEKPDRTLYEILGVSPDATPDEMKKARRRRISETHSDTNGGNDEEAKLINAAYDVLSDPEKRAKYDRDSRLGSAQDRRMACDQISTAFSIWIEGGLNTDDMIIQISEVEDPIAFIRRSADETLRRIRGNIDDQQKRINRLNRMMTRVRYKGPPGDNIFQGTISGKLEDAQASIEALNDQLRATTVVLKLLDEYEHVPMAPGQMPTVTSTFQQSVPSC